MTENNTSELIKEILDRVNTEVIGEDEEVEYYAGPDSPPKIDRNADTRNKLKAEQRSKLASIRKEV